MSEESAGVRWDSVRTDEDAPRGAGLLPLIVPWLRPASWAAGVDRVSLRLAFLMHLMAGIGFLIGLLSIDPFSEWLRHGDHSMLQLLAESFRGFARVFERHTAEALLVTAGTVAVVELGCVVVAFMVMPWGATDERVRTSFAHALRRVWLHTTQAVPIFVLGGVPITYMEHRRWLFMRSLQGQAAWRSWDTWPWWVRYDEVIIGYVAVAISLWFLWALFRAAGVRRPGSATARPPMCEYCGYNLTGTPLDRRCPECGVPAISSLGPNVRAGTAYDRAGHGGLSAMLACWLDAMLSPKTIGRQMQVVKPSLKYRRSLTAVLVPAFVACTVGLFLVARVEQRRSLDAREMIEVLSVMPFANVCAPAGLFLLAMLVAGVVGLACSIRDKRNLLGAASQMQCYLGGFLLLWLVFGWLWSTLAVSLDHARLFRDLGRAIQIDRDFVAFVFWVVPIAGLLFVDVVLVWKGTSAARYANR